MSQVLKIECRGAELRTIDELIPFQGNLKSLKEEDYLRFKRQLLKNGFSEPISTWQVDGEVKVLNGHQRLDTLRRMRSEGFTIPPIPVNVVEAENEKQAKLKVLALTSQYGTMTKESLHSYMDDFDLRLDELTADFRFAEVDFDDLRALIDDPGFNPGTEDDQGQLDQKKSHTCPECGHEF